jgi:hypothetical protein
VFLAIRLASMGSVAKLRWSGVRRRDAWQLALINTFDIGGRVAAPELGILSSDGTLFFPWAPTRARCDFRAIRYTMASDGTRLTSADFARHPGHAGVAATAIYDLVPNARRGFAALYRDTARPRILRCGFTRDGQPETDSSKSPSRWRWRVAYCLAFGERGWRCHRGVRAFS